MGRATGPPRRTAAADHARASPRRKPEPHARLAPGRVSEPSVYVPRLVPGQQTQPAAPAAAHGRTLARSPGTRLPHPAVHGEPVVEPRRPCPAGLAERSPPVVLAGRCHTASGSRRHGPLQVRAGLQRSNQRTSASRSRLTCGTEPLMLLVMQRVHISPGKALCRFCGQRVATNRLSTHIAREHPRPGRRDMTPALVPKHAPAGRRPSKQTEAGRPANRRTVE
jgi:hypothetical protein